MPKRPPPLPIPPRDITLEGVKYTLYAKKSGAMFYGEYFCHKTLERKQLGHEYSKPDEAMGDAERHAIGHRATLGRND